MACPNCAGERAARVAAEEEVARLRAELSTRHGGRPPKSAKDERGRLIAGACAALGISRKALADRLGVHPSRLSPSGQLAAKDRERLMSELRKLAGQDAGNGKKGLGHRGRVRP